MQWIPYDPLLMLFYCLSGYKSIIDDPIAFRKDKTLWNLTLLPSEEQNSMEFNPIIALRKDKTPWSLTLLPSERTKLDEFNPICPQKGQNSIIIVQEFNPIASIRKTKLNGV